MNNMKIYVIDIYQDENGISQEQKLELKSYIDISLKKGYGSLYELEITLSEILGKQVNLKRDFPEVRKDILNMIGQFERLPKNLIVEE